MPAISVPANIALVGLLSTHHMGGGRWLEGPALLGERSDEAPCLLSWGEW